MTDRSASEIAAETGDYTLFDQIVEDYLREIGVRRIHRRTKPEIGPPASCPDCGHSLTGSVRPGSHGQPCMTVLEETPDGRGIPLRCACRTVIVSDQ
jgi:hypothetical protein